MPRGYAGAKRIKAIDPFSRTHGFVDVDAGRVRDDPLGFSSAREAARVPRKLRLLMALQRRAVTGGLGVRPREKDALGGVAQLPGESLPAFQRRVHAEVRKIRAAEGDVKLKGVSEKRREYLERRKGGGRSAGGDAGGGAGGDAGGAAALAEAEAFADAFGRDVVDYDETLVPAADARRAKKRSRAEDVDAGVARGSDRVVFGERVEAPPRLTFKPTLSKSEAVAAQIRAALAAKERAAGAEPKAKVKLDKRARLAARAAQAAAAAASVARTAAARGDAEESDRERAAQNAAAASARRVALASQETATRTAPRGALRL
jgi:hypothetical protein